MSVSTMVGTRKEQFGIWVFLEVQEINSLGPLKVNINIVDFYMNCFHFKKKFLPLLTMQAFFLFFLFYRTTSSPTQVIFPTEFY